MSTNTASATTSPTVAHGLPGPAAPSHLEPSHLEPSQLAALRAALEESRRDRRAWLSALTVEDLRAADSDPTAAAEVAAARRTVQDADRALARMDDGSFGLCVHCHRPVPWPRLEFLPYAVGCVPCAQHLADRR